ncbi:MAG: hypothetical protein PHF00_05720 [Elusimicrobia bacterium]|nr:hypothetical protein [Elusimicrobiota bacterium]
MRLPIAVMSLALSMAAWSAEPAAPEMPGPERVVVRIGGVESEVSGLEDGAAQDAADFESFLLVNMMRRGVCLARLGPAFHARLRRVLSDAASAAPVRFHYLALLAPRLDERQITDIFLALRDDVRPFSEFVTERVAFFRREAAGAQAQAAGPEIVHAQRISDAMIREYNRYQLHCPFMWVEDAQSGPPPARCGYRAWDLQDAFSRVMGDAFAKPEAMRP